MVTALIGLGGTLLAAVIGGIWKWRSAKQSRANDPDMIANATARADQQVQDKTAGDLGRKDSAAIERDLS
jgi:hypothetical protein